MAGFSLNHIYEAQQFDRELLENVFDVADDMKASLTGDRQYAGSSSTASWRHCFMSPPPGPGFPSKAP